MEGIIGALRVPYVLGCVVLTLIIGPPGLVLSNYLDTWDLNRATGDFLASYSSRKGWTGVVDFTVDTAIIFYMLFMIRYMRLKLAAAEPKLVGLAPEGETTLHKIFGRVSDAKSQIITTVVLFLLIQVFLGFFEQTSSPPTSHGPLGILLTIVIGILFYLTVGIFVWVYSSTLWGLHRFGKEPLRLKPFYEDRILGVEAIGSLSLSLALAYYTVFGPVAFESILLAPDLVGYATVVPLVILGGVMFFLPLNSIHLRMLKEKKREEENLRRQMAQLFERHNPGLDVADSMSGQIEKLLKLEMLQVAEKRLEEVPSWPYDKKTVERFVAIFLSVMSVLGSKIVLIVLAYLNL